MSAPIAWTAARPLFPVDTIRPGHRLGGRVLFDYGMLKVSPPRWHARLWTWMQEPLRP